MASTESPGYALLYLSLRYLYALSRSNRSIRGVNDYLRAVDGWKLCVAGACPCG